MFHIPLLKKAIVALALLDSSRAQSTSSGPSYSPARPPAIPLAVRGPYTSAWTSTFNGGTLNSNGVIFWPGNALGWEGLATVDGITYEYLGTGSQELPTIPSLRSATPLTVSYDSQYSNFTFAAGPVELTASFLSPVLPEDLCRTSIPLSYLTVTARSTDNGTHNVQLYNDVNGAWIAYESNTTVEWAMYEGSDPIKTNGSATSNSSVPYTWLSALAEPYFFGEERDFPQWGNFSFSSAQGAARNMTYGSGYSANLRYQYINSHSLQNNVDQDFRGWGEQEPVFAYAHDLGSVSGSGSAATTYSLGTIQEPVIRYLTSSGIVSLQPWWSQCYGDMFSMIAFHYNDLSLSQQLALKWEAQLKSDVQSYYNANPAPAQPSQSQYLNSTNAAGQIIFDSADAYGYLNTNNYTGVAVPGISEADAYYSIVALSARQVMGAYVLAIPPASNALTNQNASEPLMFPKEISSDGNANTVDVMYPAMPFFLYANPALLRYNLKPLLQNQESYFYPNTYSMHDLGTNFPNATGHVEGNDEYMPVEESGNMILMSYAYAYFSSDSAFLTAHYPLLKQFSEYLREYSLLPGVQLSTDDFAGELVNQTNLAIKGIVGLAAMREIASLVGQSSDSANFSTTASDYFSKWETYAIDPSRKHAVLSYQYRSSYGLLYNTFPSLLLNLSIIPSSIFDMQSAFYPTISQIFGIPLDSRHEYTKSDWEMWTAATCSPATRSLFVTSLAYWLNNTNTGLPFTDLYDTTDGGFPTNPNINFLARPVAGGHFSLLALEKSRSLGS